MTSPPVILPHHPLDVPGVSKIALGHAASAALAAVGPHHFVIATRADATAPQWAAGHLVLHCLPLTKQLAIDAADVALGRATVRRVKPTKGTSPP
ncbi:MAG: hypothetical protein NTW21_37575 [Verrucomicrobia bacterium]|nr:hypothetical protein [Verrucomicrobiota bacterium]